LLRSLQFIDIQFLHFQQGSHDALLRGLVGAAGLFIRATSRGGSSGWAKFASSSCDH
jgi:hypothetical protein